MSTLLYTHAVCRRYHGLIGTPHPTCMGRRMSHARRCAPSAPHTVVTAFRAPVLKVLPLSTYITGHSIMTTLRIWCYILASGALIPLSASAEPTVNTLGGDTRVQLSGDLVGALTSLGVSVRASHPARLRGAQASFPIPGGELDLGTLKGEVDHGGGLTLRAGGTEVNLSSYTIDTTGAAPYLLAW